MVDVRLLWIAVGFIVVAGCAHTSQRVVDLGAKPQDILHSGHPSATVLIFVSNDCPIANRYVPELQKLRDHFAPRGAVFWLVHSDPSETVAAIRQHARQYHLDFPEARDPRHQLANLAKAEVTPTAAVFSRDGKLVYHGRIDDRFVELGRERPQATRHDLADALEAALDNRHVLVSATKAIGCYIPAAQ